MRFAISFTFFFFGVGGGGGDTDDGAAGGAVAGTSSMSSIEYGLAYERRIKSGEPVSRKCTNLSDDEEREQTSNRCVEAEADDNEMEREMRWDNDTRSCTYL